jgi:hypothetical protein
MPRIDSHFYPRVPIVRPNTTVPGEASKTLTIEIHPPVDRYAIDGVQKGDTNIIFHGEFAFSGVQGADYVQTFAFIYNLKAKRFLPMDAEHNKRSRISQATEPARRWWQFWKEHL